MRKKADVRTAGKRRGAAVTALLIAVFAVCVCAAGCHRRPAEQGVEKELTGAVRELEEAKEEVRKGLEEARGDVQRARQEVTEGTAEALKELENAAQELLDQVPEDARRGIREGFQQGAEAIGQGLRRMKDGVD